MKVINGVEIYDQEENQVKILDLEALDGRTPYEKLEVRRLLVDGYTKEEIAKLYAFTDDVDDIKAEGDDDLDPSNYQFETIKHRKERLNVENNINGSGTNNGNSVNTEPKKVEAGKTESTETK